MFKRIVLSIFLALSVNAVVLNHNAQAAFPFNGVLDNYNRANSATTLGTNYTLPSSGWGDLAGIISDTAYDPTAADGFIAEWNVTNFSGTLEAYVTLSTLGGDGNPDGVAFTTSISTTASSGYEVMLSDSTIYVYKTVNGTNTQLTTFSPSSPANGDKIGATLSPAGVITVWYAPVGTGIWGSMGTYTDTTYSCSNIGIVNLDGDGTVRYDDFGGGTVINLPTVTTQATTSITSTTATGNGNITSTGGANPTLQGVVYAISSQALPGNVAPASSGYSLLADTSGSFGTGAFTQAVTGLTPCIEYFMRAFAENSQGYSYGNEITFGTGECFNGYNINQYNINTY